MKTIEYLENVNSVTSDKKRGWLGCLREEVSYLTVDRCEQLCVQAQLLRRHKTTRSTMIHSSMFIHVRRELRQIANEIFDFVKNIDKQQKNIDKQQDIFQIVTSQYL